MDLFQEDILEIGENIFLNFEKTILKKNIGLGYYEEYATKENNIIKIDKNINLFPLNQFDSFYEEEKKSNIFLTNKRIFKVEYPFKDKEDESTKSLELKAEDDSDCGKKKRSKQRQNRYTYKDLIEQKIKRHFCNGYLIKNLNNILKEEKFNLLFKKFSQCFTNNVTKEDNNNILNMTLGQIFTEKSLYNNDLKNCEHNLKVINILKKETSKVNEILEKKKYCELYQDYLNSNEYNIKINKIMQKYKGKNDYIKRFIYFSRHFMELFEK